MEKRLTHLVQSSIVEILGFEGSGINHGKTGIVASDNVLFDQLHDSALLSAPDLTGQFLQAPGVAPLQSSYLVPCACAHAPGRHAARPYGECSSASNHGRGDNTMAQAGCTRAG